MQLEQQTLSTELSGPAPRILVVEARYYNDISDFLMEGAVRALEKANASYKSLSVPGALEIPAAIAIAHQSDQTFDGYVALGCVIRGETTHYEIVSEQSCHGLMQLGLQGLAIGNGILTVENREQALARALPDKQDKGGSTVTACLSLIAARQIFAK